MGKTRITQITFRILERCCNDRTDLTKRSRVSISRCRLSQTPPIHGANWAMCCRGRSDSRKRFLPMITRWKSISARAGKESNPGNGALQKRPLFPAPEEVRGGLYQLRQGAVDLSRSLRSLKRPGPDAA